MKSPIYKICFQYLILCKKGSISVNDEVFEACRAVLNFNATDKEKEVVANYFKINEKNAANN